MAGEGDRGCSLQGATGGESLEHPCTHSNSKPHVHPAASSPDTATERHNSTMPSAHWDLSWLRRGAASVKRFTGLVCAATRGWAQQRAGRASCSLRKGEPRCSQHRYHPHQQARVPPGLSTARCCFTASISSSMSCFQQPRSRDYIGARGDEPRTRLEAKLQYGSKAHLEAQPKTVTICLRVLPGAKQSIQGQHQRQE